MNTTNLALILLKVWQTKRSITGKMLTDIFRLVPSLAVFLESGLIYCVVVLILFGLFFTNSAAQIVVLNAVSNVIFLLRTVADPAHLVKLLDSKHHCVSDTYLCWN